MSLLTPLPTCSLRKKGKRNMEKGFTCNISILHIYFMRCCHLQYIVSLREGISRVQMKSQRFGKKNKNKKRYCSTHQAAQNFQQSLSLCVTNSQTHFLDSRSRRFIWKRENGGWAGSEILSQRFFGDHLNLTWRLPNPPPPQKKDESSDGEENCPH